jgi:hypothetical protein
LMCVGRWFLDGVDACQRSQSHIIDRMIYILEHGDSYPVVNLDECTCRECETLRSVERAVAAWKRMPKRKAFP